MDMKSIQLGFFIVAFAVSAAAQSNVTTTSGGTAGTVSVFTSSTNIESSVITQSNGNVGIGTTNPLVPLDVIGNLHVSGGANPLIPGEGTYLGWNALTGGTGEADFINNQGEGLGGFAFMNTPISGTPISTLMFLTGTGRLGVGTTSPQYPLDVAGQIHSSTGGYVFPDGTTQTTAFIPANCGADYAESVGVSGDRTKYEPGDLLVIDPDHPGKFLKSNQPYSTTVAGIYSTKPGFVGRKQPASEPASQDEVPMAMVGRVPTKVSAENGPIKVGDLLVTSSAVGYAMKGTDRSQMMGAVVGKALGSLDSGTGVIEVLVALQ